MAQSWKALLEADAMLLAGLGLVAVVLVAFLVAFRARSRRRRIVADAATQAPGENREVERVAHLRRGVAKTRAGLLTRLGGLLEGRSLDPSTRDELEAALLAADVGVRTTDRLLRNLARTGSEGTLREALERDLIEILEGLPRPVVAVARPHVVMVVGVNGAGKTTSIGKLACRYASAGKRVLLVAGDTFRAAAADQLAVWAERARCAFVRQAQGSDPGSVVFDGMRSALARGVDVVLIDTAGRLHTKTHLMAELRKVRRIIARELPGAPHETLLVLDATTGQNGLRQAAAFLEQLEVSGVVLTKLDGTAKGGVVISIAVDLGLPIHWIGTGEGIEDLDEFDPRAFVRAMLDVDEASAGSGR